MTHEDIAQLVVATRNHLHQLDAALEAAIKAGEAADTKAHIQVEMKMLRDSITQLELTWLHLRRVVHIGEAAAIKARNVPTDKA